jgi:hypothetical protein
MKKEFEKDQIVYHRFRGKGIFECYSPEYNCAWVKFDNSLGVEKVTLSLLSREKV